MTHKITIVQEPKIKATKSKHIKVIIRKIKKQEKNEKFFIFTNRVHLISRINPIFGHFGLVLLGV